MFGALATESSECSSSKLYDVFKYVLWTKKRHPKSMLSTFSATVISVSKTIHSTTLCSFDK